MASIQVNTVIDKLSILKSGILLTKRGFLVNLILSFIFFTFYYIFSAYVLRFIITPSSENFLMANAALNFAIAGAVAFTSFFINKINKLFTIYTFSIIVSLLSVLLFFVSNYIFRLTSIFLMGILFGIGQLTFFTYFWSTTAPEERGRIGGFIGLISLPLYFASVVVAGTLDFLGTIVLSLILSLGTLLVILLRPGKTVLTTKRDNKENYPEKRTVFMYSIPWVTFSLINATLSKNISLYISQIVPSSFYLFLILLQIIAAVIGALGGGFIADFLGRRLALALSVTLYGISMALAGLIQNYGVFYFVYFANGLGWGLLLTMYTLVIWGDLANKENCAKMYSIGLITFYLAAVLGSFLTPIAQVALVPSALIGCTLIFLSNVPIALAPELLSSDFQERIRLRLHMNAVRKINKKQQDQG